jgi:hypothetical protein
LEIPLTHDLAHQHYNISLTLGTPPQPFKLLFDTGATDVWVPTTSSRGCAPNCPTGFDPSTSSSLVNLSIPFEAVLSGYYNDTVPIGSVEIQNLTFAIGDVPEPFVKQGTWGIFGAGSRYAESVYRSPTSPFYLDEAGLYTLFWEPLAGGRRKFSV